MPSRPGDGIKTNAWRKLQAHVVAISTHCALCGKPLVPGAKPRSPWSTEVDHIVKREHGGPLLDPNNVRASHKRCNVQREHDHRRAQRKPPRRSREW